LDSALFIPASVTDTVLLGGNANFSPLLQRSRRPAATNRKTNPASTAVAFYNNFDSSIEGHASGANPPGSRNKESTPTYYNTDELRLADSAFIGVVDLFSVWTP